MSCEEYTQELRLYAYTTSDNKKGHISGYSAINAKRRVANRGIVHLPMEVEVQELEEKGQHTRKDYQHEQNMY